MEAAPESDESPEVDEAERLAALLAELPEEPAASGNNKGTGSLLEHSALCSLFNKLHLSGQQLRALPSEFTPTCISSILLTVKSILCAEPSCLQIESPTVMFGDLHGEFHILVKLTDILGKPPLRSFLFLGDYVDRGPHSLETLLYLLLLKAVEPSHVFVLRGNHEDRRVYRFFNFEDDLVRQFGLSKGQNLSTLFNTVLCYLPVCAILNKEIFCCHGGLSPQFNHPRFANTQQDFVQRINQLAKPVLFRRSDFVADLLWSDPLDLQNSCMPNLHSVTLTIEEWVDKRLNSLGCEAGHKRISVKRHQDDSPRGSKAKARERSDTFGTGHLVSWAPNPRGCSYVFSKAAFDEFMERYKMTWLVRGHMFVSRGHRECFDGRCITLFSAADYAQKYHNTGAVIVIDGASKGNEFPGRILCFTKGQLLKYSGQLPTDASKWPHEIVAKARP